MDKYGAFNANQTSMCLIPLHNKSRGLNLLFLFVFANTRCLQPCGHMLGKSRPLGFIVLCFVFFLFSVLGQVWYLIVSIPDLYLLPFNKR